MKFSTFCASGWLLLAAHTATAATYYVSVSGADSNPGTQAQPWATLQQALNVVVAGDTVIEGPGLYSEFNRGISTVKDGQPGAPITLMAQPGAVHQGSGIYLGNSNYVISGFTISNLTFTPHMYGGFVLGPTAHNTFIHDCTLRDFTLDCYQYGVVWYTPNVDANMKVAVDAAACNCVVSNCVITNVFSCQPFLFAGTNNLIINNRITHGLSSDVFVGHGAHNYIRGNVISNFELVSGGFHPDMFQTYGQDGNVLSAGDPYFDSYHIVADHNQFWDCNISFAQMTTDDTNHIVNVSDWEIMDNLFVRCGSTNGSISSISIPGTKWLNNTFILCGTNSSASGDVLGFVLHNQADPGTGDFRGQATNTVICNNAFIACGRSVNNGWFEIDSGYGIPTNNWNFTIAKNLVVDWSGVAWRPKNSQLQTLIKNDPNDPDVYQVPADINPGIDPRLVAWSNASFAADCRPLIGSPLIDAGTNLAAYVANDLERAARPLGNGFDLGCFEYDPALQVHLDFAEDFQSSGRIVDTTGGGHEAWNFNPTNWISGGFGAMGPAGRWTVVGVMTNDPGQTYNLSQYAGITNLNGIQFLTNGTISVWVQWATNGERWDTILDGGYPIPYSWDPTVATNSWALHYGSPDLNQNPTGPVFKRYGSSLNDTNGVLITWTQPRDGSTWWHLAVVWNGANNTIVGYQNGVPIQTNKLGAPYLRVSGSPRLGVPPYTIIPWLSVGAMQHDGTPQWGDDKYPNSGFFKGQMGDLRIYSRALSGGEVANLYAVPMTAAQTAAPTDNTTVAVPSVSLTASPASVAAGQSTTLSWTSANATSLTVSGLGSVALNGSAVVTPTSDTTYTATATGPGGTQTASTTVTVTSGSIVPTVTLTASPSTITNGQGATLYWTSTNATNVTWVNFGQVSLNGNAGVWPTATTTYTITATGPGGTASANATVTVGASTATPTVTLTASPTSITSGQSSVLTWTSSDATNMTVTGFGSVDLNGSASVSPTTSTTYTATAMGPSGTQTASATVTVTATVTSGAAAPTVTLTASPATVSPGQYTTLYWTSANATNLYWVGFDNVSLNGNACVWPNATTTYTVIGTGPGGTTSANATVTVATYPTAPVTFAAPTGNLTFPFVATNGYVYQAVQTLIVTNGGEASYYFNVDQPGQYAVQAVVCAAAAGTNSCFINVDAEPQSPAMIWDIPITSGFQTRTASWRGTGTAAQNEYIPVLFNLSTGPHQLIIRGRDSNVLLQSLSILKRPNAPGGLMTVSN